MPSSNAKSVDKKQASEAKKGIWRSHFRKGDTDVRERPTGTHHGVGLAMGFQRARPRAT